MKEKMSTKMAEKLAGLAFGPSAQCIRHSKPQHRDQRFAIYYTDDPPEDRIKEGFKAAVYIAGHGDSWDSAFKMANENPIAQAKAAKIVELRKVMQQRMIEEEQKRPVPEKIEPSEDDKKMFKEARKKMFKEARKKQRAVERKTKKERKAKRNGKR